MYVLAIDTTVYYNLHWFVMIFKRYPVSDYDCHQGSSTLSICALFTWTKYLLYERRRYTVIQCPKALLASSLLPSCAPSALPPPPPLSRTRLFSPLPSSMQPDLLYHPHIYPRPQQLEWVYPVSFLFSFFLFSFFLSFPFLFFLFPSA